MPLEDDGAWMRHTPSEFENASKSVRIRNGRLAGELFATDPNEENICCTEKQQGFRTLACDQFPNRNLFKTTGFNFEHIFSGRERDWAKGEFAPRKEPSALRVFSESSAALFWAAENSSWRAHSQMTFSLDDTCRLDMEFKTNLTADPNCGDLVYMWASYMKQARAPEVRYWGAKKYQRKWDNIDWMSIRWFPDPERRSRGIVPYLGVVPPPWEPNVPELNFRESVLDAFLIPVFFGCMDGDGDPSTTKDDMAYILMFDRAEDIRFIMWDFDGGGVNPVWDWQYIVRAPQPGKTYGYRLRLAYKPYAGPEDVMSEYVRWVKSLGEPRHRLKIDVDPPESAAVFPAETAGGYGEGVRVYFGVNPSPGWTFVRWEGNVKHKDRRYTSVEMRGAETVRAVCRRTIFGM